MTAAPPPLGPPPAPTGWGEYPGSAPPGQPPGGQVPVGARTEGLAVGALVCAIASFVVCPVIAAIVALSLAYNGGNRIADSGGLLRGSGMVTAAKILGWLNLSLAVAFVVLIDLALLNA